MNTYWHAVVARFKVDVKAALSCSTIAKEFLVALSVGTAAWAFKENVLVSVATVLVALLVQVFVVCIWYWMHAPRRVYEDQRQYIRELLARNETLEVALAPKLALRFQPGVEPFEHSEPAGIYDVPADLRIFRLAVQNSGGKTLEHCSVKLVDFGGTVNVYLPVALKQMSDNPSDVMNIAHKQEFTLRPGELVFIDIAALRETKKDSEIELCYALEGYRTYRMGTHVKRNHYALTIEAYADEGKPVSKRYRLWVNEDGLLRLKEDHDEAR